MPVPSKWLFLMTPPMVPSLMSMFSAVVLEIGVAGDDVVVARVGLAVAVGAPVADGGSDVDAFAELVVVAAGVADGVADDQVAAGVLAQVDALVADVGHGQVLDDRPVAGVGDDAFLTVLGGESATGPSSWRRRGGRRSRCWCRRRPGRRRGHRTGRSGCRAAAVAVREVPGVGAVLRRITSPGSGRARAARQLVASDTGRVAAGQVTSWVWGRRALSGGRDARWRPGSSGRCPSRTSSWTCPVSRSW